MNFALHVKQHHKVILFFCATVEYSVSTGFLFLMPVFLGIALACVHRANKLQLAKPVCAIAGSLLFLKWAFVHSLAVVVTSTFVVSSINCNQLFWNTPLDEPDTLPTSANNDVDDSQTDTNCLYLF